MTCRYHLELLIDVDSIEYERRFPGLESWEMPFSCALDMAAFGPREPSMVAGLLGYDEGTLETLRKMETHVLKKLAEELRR